MMTQTILKVLNSVFIATAICSIYACKKDTPTQIEVTVKMKDGSLVNNSSIALLSDNSTVYYNSDIVKQQSGTDGKVLFNVNPSQTYYLYHYSADSNIIDDADSTYISKSVFKTLSEIQNSPVQSPVAKVGDIKYADVNVDGAINKYDLVKKVISPSSGKTVSVTFMLRHM